MRYLWDNSCMVKRFVNGYMKSGRKILFLFAKIVGTYVRFEYKLRFMREVMVQYLQ